MGLIERKLAVIDAAAAWAEAIREHGPEAARPFRATFEMALDDALTATNQGAVEALREIKRVAAIEAPPVSEEVPAKVWKIAFDALNHLGGQ